MRAEKAPAKGLTHRGPPRTRAAMGFVDAANVPAAAVDRVVLAVLVDAAAEAGGRSLKPIAIEQGAPFNHGAPVSMSHHGQERAGLI
jgi:hypothetical protein